MSSEVRHFQPRPDIALGMTDMRLEALRLVALGLVRYQIAPQLQTTKHAVDQLICDGYRALGANDEVHGVLTLIAHGIFDLDELSAGFDLDKFDLLKPYHHRILQRMVKDDGRDSANKLIGKDLGLRSIGQRMHEIYMTIGEYSRTRTGVLYVAYQRQRGARENEGVVFASKPLTAAK